MSKEIALSTDDNPFNPIKDFEEWYAYDTQKGYNTCAYLARVSRTSEDYSEAEEDEAIDEAINEIVELNLIGQSTNFEVNYIKVTEDYRPTRGGVQKLAPPS